MMFRSWALAALVMCMTVFGASQPNPAHALGLCNCCGAAGGGDACAQACSEVNDNIGLCRPTVSFDKRSQWRNNPLYGHSLRGLRIGTASNGQLERFRRYIEHFRRRAERKYSRARRSYARGRTSAQKLLDVQAERDSAMVNYHHAVQAYIDATRRP